MKKYNCCKECGSNCIKKWEFCFKCRIKRKRSEKIMKAIKAIEDNKHHTYQTCSNSKVGITETSYWKRD